MSNAFKPLPVKFTLLWLRNNLAMLEHINDKSGLYDNFIKDIKIKILQAKLEEHKNRLNWHLDPANMLDGKHGRISFKFKWLDIVEKKIMWRKWSFDLYKAFNYGWPRKVEEDGI